MCSQQQDGTLWVHGRQDNPFNQAVKRFVSRMLSLAWWNGRNIDGLMGFLILSLTFTDGGTETRSAVKGQRLKAAVLLVCFLHLMFPVFSGLSLLGCINRLLWCICEVLGLCFFLLKNRRVRLTKQQPDVWVKNATATTWAEVGRSWATLSYGSS